MKDLYSIVGLTKSGPLTDEQREKLELGLRTLAKKAGLDRQSRKSEKSRDVAPDSQNGDGGADRSTTEQPEPDGKPGDKRDGSPTASGHGRNGASAYGGAKRCRVPHDSLKPGDPCPDCVKGTLYEQTEPAVLVRITGQAPLGAQVVERQRLRCNPCGKVFTAPVPDNVGDEKYDASAAAMIGLFRYGTGLPFNRLQRLQGNLEIPLPASTQWDIVLGASDKLKPLFDALCRRAAQGELVHNDDTTMRILAFKKSGYREEHGSPADRTGTFTSGIVAVVDGRTIALYFTGWKHAGENLADVFRLRAADLPVPIQMCDGLSHNVSKEFSTLLANCLPHARRKFVEIIDAFPDECRTVIRTLRDVYRNDALAKERGLSKEERLLLHQADSGPIMDQLRTWLNEQLDQRIVEPNSSLGESMRYMRKHWNELTLFLRVAGAPLDNNIAERALKRAIMHRKNSLFYKTLNGARAGDIFQSLIHTAELARVNPFEPTFRRIDQQPCHVWRGRC